jgi:Polyketide cyclase / dehydrase and lipid transport
MTHIEVDVDTRLPSERVVAALTDFSDRRPDIWPGLAREYYEVYSVGEGTAEVQEGSTKPFRVRAKEHYDWSTPGTVTWTVKESNFCTPGSFVSARITPAQGGSHIHLTWERSPSNLKGRVIILMMALFGRKVLSTYTMKVLDGLAETQGSP